MVATSGDRLLDDNAIAAVREVLIPLAGIITPNLPEAAALLDCRGDHGRPRCSIRPASCWRLDRVLCCSKAATARVAKRSMFWSPRIRIAVRQAAHRDPQHPWHRLHAGRRHHRGLALGQPLPVAVQHAKDFVWSALLSGAHWRIGAGNGPVDHLFFVRKHTRLCLKPSTWHQPFEHCCGSAPRTSSLPVKHFCRTCTAAQPLAVSRPTAAHGPRNSLRGERQVRFEGFGTELGIKPVRFGGPVFLCPILGGCLGGCT